MPRVFSESPRLIMDNTSASNIHSATHHYRTPLYSGHPERLARIPPIFLSAHTFPSAKYRRTVKNFRYTIII